MWHWTRGLWGIGPDKQWGQPGKIGDSWIVYASFTLPDKNNA